MTKSLFHHTKREEHCPQCGAILQIKNGKKGLFLGCSAYPECDYLRPLQRAEHKVLKELDEHCPQCGAILQLKQGAFGMFIGCSAYPTCNFVVHEKPQTEVSIPCPACQTGHLVATRQSLLWLHQLSPLQIFLAGKTLSNDLSGMQFSACLVKK